MEGLRQVAVCSAALRPFSIRHQILSAPPPWCMMLCMSFVTFGPNLPRAECGWLSSDMSTFQVNGFPPPLAFSLFSAAVCFVNLYLAMVTAKRRAHASCAVDMPLEPTTAEDVCSWAVGGRSNC